MLCGSCIGVDWGRGFGGVFMCNIICLVVGKGVDRVWKDVECEGVFGNWEVVVCYDYMV